MTKVIFILGLCGSGKSYHAEKIQKNDPTIFIIDEGFNPIFDQKLFNSNYEKVIKNLRAGNVCIVIEMVLCNKSAREIIMQKLKQDIPGIKIEWKCFENNIEKANKNLLNNTRQKGDIEGHKEINVRVSPNYTYPDGAETLPIITTDD